MIPSLKVRMAQGEADKAYAQAKTPMTRYNAYRRIYDETITRFERAEEILEAGLVSPDGSKECYVVQSQNGNGRYTVSLRHGICHCKDFKMRGGKCKHIIAAELYELQQAPPVDGRREKAKRYVTLYNQAMLASNWDNPEFRELELYFAFLNWNYSNIERYAREGKNAHTESARKRQDGLRL